MKKYLMSLVALLLLGFPARMNAQAQDQGSDQGQDQGPNQGQDQGQDPAQLGPGVARVSFIGGDVSTQSGDSGDWNAATLNTPVVAGDRVSTGPKSRAEIQLDYANVLRLDQNSVAKIANLSRTQLQAQVGQGVADYSMLKGNQADVEIDTPNAAIHPLKEGQYHIEIAANDMTRVSVLRGSADVTTPQGSAHVEAGQMITVQGTTNPQYQLSDARSKDDFDKWSTDRDKLIANAESWRYTNPYYTGTQDLDAYGQWASAPGYGNVWIPAQAPGWAPYSAGRWVWQPYYGWTWVSTEPWGWAPYHYGRWFVYGNSWAWWPGPVYASYYPVYAPAYVSFFGFGGGWGFGFGFGGGWGYASFGWLPCGPGDWYRPWWGRWGGGGVHITNITNITNIYNNRYGGRPTVGTGIRPLSARGFSNMNSMLTNDRVRQGISSMSSKEFGRASVPRQTHSIDAATLRQASAMTGRIPAVPTKASLRSTDRPASASTIRAGDNQHFFSKNTPPATSRNFNQQAAAAQKMVDSSRTDMNKTLASNSGSAAADRRTSTSTRTGREPSSGASTRENMSSGQGTSPQREGWHSFSGQGGTGAAAAGQATTKGEPVQRPAPNSRENQTPRGQSTPSARPNSSSSPQSGSGWQSFKPRTPTPNSSPSASNGRGAAAGNSGRPGWQSFSASPRSGLRQGGTSRAGHSSYGSRSAGNYGYSRPPLDLHQPIVTQRSASSYGGNYGSYGRSQGNYGRGQGSYGPPSSGGHYGGSAPSSHPSGGGGHPSSSGGGGGHGGGGGGHRGGGGHGGGHR